jgi:adsorption protein B
MPARYGARSFLPSTGVGVGYSRAALERLAAENRDRVFDPTCLTEDYDDGLRLHRMGFPQQFIPVRFRKGRPLATREYFPDSFRAALRQRTRWIMGNALQAWQRHGFRGGPLQAYWFWRDRKGLIGNLASAAANLIFLYGMASWFAAWRSGTAWGLGAAAQPYRLALLATLALQVHRLLFRMTCVGEVYGWPFAAAVPVRALWANALNAAATVAALIRYSRARLLHEPLAWLKTEHVYPSRAELAGRRRPIGELMVQLRVVSQERLDRALATQPRGVRLGEYLISTGDLAEDELYAALSLQQSIPFEPIEPGEIPRSVARALPGEIARRWQIVPFKIADGGIYVAGPELPGNEAQRDLERHTALQIRFQYITPTNYRELLEKFLAPSDEFR